MKKTVSPDAEKAHHTILTSPVNGIVKSLTQVEDPVFSTYIMGEGIAIIPEDNLVVSPVEGEITCLYQAKQAIGITTLQGVEILIHIGIDTVRLGETYFDCYVQQDTHVLQGDPLIRFHQKEIRENGYACDVIMIIANTEQFAQIKVIAEGRITRETPLLKIQ